MKNMSGGVLVLAAGLIVAVLALLALTDVISLAVAALMIGAAVSLVMLMAQVKLFAIAATLEKILAELKRQGGPDPYQENPSIPYFRDRELKKTK